MSDNWFESKVLGNGEHSVEKRVTEEQKQSAITKRIIETNITLGNDIPLDVEQFEESLLKNGDIIGDELFKEVRERKRKRVDEDYVPEAIRVAFDSMEYEKLPRKYKVRTPKNKLGFHLLEDKDYVLVLDRALYNNNETVLMRKFTHWQQSMRRKAKQYPNTFYAEIESWEIHVIYDNDKAYIKRVI